MTVIEFRSELYIYDGLELRWNAQKHRNDDITLQSTSYILLLCICAGRGRGMWVLSFYEGWSMWEKVRSLGGMR